MGEKYETETHREIMAGGEYVLAYWPELVIPSCGNSVEQAKSNLREVIVIHLEEAEKQGRLSELLINISQGTFSVTLVSCPLSTLTACKVCVTL